MENAGVGAGFKWMEKNSLLTLGKRNNTHANKNIPLVESDSFRQYLVINFLGQFSFKYF